MNILFCGTKLYHFFYACFHRIHQNLFKNRIFKDRTLTFSHIEGEYILNMKNISIQGNCSPLTFPKLFSSKLSWTNGNIYSWEYIHFCFELSKCPCDMIPIFVTTAWKVSKYGVISGPYFPVFGPAITPYLDTLHAVTDTLLQPRLLKVCVLLF